MQTVAQALQRLQRSAFRSKFHLSAQERAYVASRGMEVIRCHAQALIAQRLAPAYPKKDGAQTPLHGHPVFVAQHACACCCRSCLQKWYRVPKGVPLTEVQQQRIVSLLLGWIEAEMKNSLGKMQQNEKNNE